jgi:hypothetical protein
MLLPILEKYRWIAQVPSGGGQIFSSEALQNMKKIFGAGLFAFTLAATATVASAAPACAIGTNLIENAAGSGNVVDNGLAATVSAIPASQSCTLGSLTFSNFQYTLAPPTGFENAPFQVLVNNIIPSGNDVVLGFNPDTASGSDLQLEFQVTGVIQGVDLSYNGNTGAINEEVCLVYMQSGVCPTASDVNGPSTLSSLGVNPTNQNAQLNFTTAQTSIWIFKDIAAGAGFFSEVNQSFVVPEPMTFSLLGVGLLGLGLMGRRRASK